MNKRTLDNFFSPPSKRAKQDSPDLSNHPPISHARVLSVGEKDDINLRPTSRTLHKSWPHPIADLPTSVSQPLEDLLGTAEGKTINNQPHLELLFFQPLIPQPTASDLFRFLRAELPFYRVCYKITRFGKSVDINTPRYTTVFGLDDSSRFTTTIGLLIDGVSTHSTKIVESSLLTKEVGTSKYRCVPRLIPPCLALLKNITEALTGDTYNFVLVNYYASGSDSISYHSDDESFLGSDPAIASFSLGARRDFFMKHKPPKPPPGVSPDDKSVEKVFPGTSQIKLPLGSGDMILMRGKTQSNWLHSIPKRTAKSGEAEKGRINITMRKAMVPGGTENYYRYNVGDGPVYRWDDKMREMRLWEPVKV